MADRSVPQANERRSVAEGAKIGLAVITGRVIAARGYRRREDKQAGRRRRHTSFSRGRGRRRRSGDGRNRLRGYRTRGRAGHAVIDIPWSARRGGASAQSKYGQQTNSRKPRSREQHCSSFRRASPKAACSRYTTEPPSHSKLRSVLALRGVSVIHRQFNQRMPRCSPTVD